MNISYAMASLHGKQPWLVRKINTIFLAFVREKAILHAAIWKKPIVDSQSSSTDTHTPTLVFPGGERAPRTKTWHDLCLQVRVSEVIDQTRYKFVFTEFFVSFNNVTLYVIHLLSV